MCDARGAFARNLSELFLSPPALAIHGLASRCGGVVKQPTRVNRLLELTVPQGPDEFAAAVIDGLSKPRKTLPCQFLYDARGSALFEQITELPEYYPTRTEIGILREQAA